MNLGSLGALQESSWLRVNFPSHPDSLSASAVGNHQILEVLVLGSASTGDLLSLESCHQQITRSWQCKAQGDFHIWLTGPNCGTWAVLELGNIWTFAMAIAANTRFKAPGAGKDQT